MMNRTSLAFFMLAALGSGALIAHEGHLHRVMGVVAAIDPAQIEIETKDGRKQSLAVNHETRFVRGRLSVAATDVRAGERAVISVKEKNGKQWVTEVRLAELRGSGATPPKR